MSFVDWDIKVDEIVSGPREISIWVALITFWTSVVLDDFCTRERGGYIWYVFWSAELGSARRAKRQEFDLVRLERAQPLRLMGG